MHWSSTTRATRIGQQRQRLRPRQPTTARYIYRGAEYFYAYRLCVRPTMSVDDSPTVISIEASLGFAAPYGRLPVDAYEPILSYGPIQRVPYSW